MAIPHPMTLVFDGHSDAMHDLIIIRSLNTLLYITLHLSQFWGMGALWIIHDSRIEASSRDVGTSVNYMNLSPIDGVFLGMCMFY